MRFRALGRVALLSISIALSVWGLGNLLLEPSTLPSDSGMTPTDWGLPGISALWSLGFAGVGYVIARRQPANPIGWLLLVSGIFAGFTGALAPLATGGAPGFVTDVWMVAWVPAVAGLVTSVALLPNGSLPSRRWRPTVWLLWTGVALMWSVTFIGDGSAVETWVGLVFQASLIAVLVSVAVRFRRSRGVERQQLKWIAAAGIFVGSTALAGEIGMRLFLPDWYYWSTVLLSLAMATVPVAIGVAILRHQLYDIDRLISRTVTWGMVSALLVAVYVTVVFGLRLLLPTQGELAVAASTLAVAALFNPVRRRMQALVDHRFNRSRYDAIRTIDEFARRARSDVDVEDLSGELRTTAALTMEPESVSVWLADPDSD